MSLYQGCIGLNDALQTWVTKGQDAHSIVVNKSLHKPLVLERRPSINHIVLKEGSYAHLVLDSSLSLPLRVHVEENAHLDLYCLSTGSDPGPTNQHLVLELEKDSNASIFEMAFLESEVTRTMNVNLRGKNAAINYHGLDQLTHRAKKTSLLTISHQEDKTMSAMHFRGVYSGEASGNFLGKVIVEKDASDCVAKQYYKALLLAKTAKAKVMPELLIYNNDVSASHGASVGQLDENALFYLCSRGIKRPRAQALLVRSFVDDIVHKVKEESLKSALSALVARSIDRAVLVTQ